MGKCEWESLLGVECQTYIYDNSGNQPGDPEFDPEDTFGVYGYKD